MCKGGRPKVENAGDSKRLGAFGFGFGLVLVTGLVVVVVVVVALSLLWIPVIQNGTQYGGIVIPETLNSRQSRVPRREVGEEYQNYAVRQPAQDARIREVQHGRTVNENGVKLSSKTLQKLRQAR